MTVTKVGSIYRVLFNGALAAANQPLMTVSSTPGVTAAINAIYGLTVSNVVNDPTPGAPSAGGLEGSGFRDAFRAAGLEDYYVRRSAVAKTDCQRSKAASAIRRRCSDASESSTSGSTATASTGHPD